MSANSSISGRMSRMLSDYINSCTEAKAKGDEASLRKIERNLARLGMDEMTLKVVVADEMERRKNQ